MFESNRNFQLWEFSLGHSQLLIRSPSTRDYSTNIDLVFRGVEFVTLPTKFDGLRIVRVGPATDAELNFSPSIYSDMFLIESAKANFEVVAVSCTVLENTLDMFESSLESFTTPSENRDLGVVLAHSKPP